MEVDPYQVLSLRRDFNLADLRSQYKTIALSVHPDKVQGQSDYMFKLVTKCYRILLQEWKSRQADKQFDVLKSDFKSDVQQNYRRSDIEKDDFNIERFNKIFDDNRISTVTDVGYDKWMNQNSVKDAPTLSKGLSSENFNKQFEQYSTITASDRKHNKQIMKYKDPEPLMMSKNLSYIELGVDKIDDFSGKHNGLEFSDYSLAHSTSRLVDPSIVKRREFKTVGEMEKYRENIRKLSSRELEYLEKKKMIEKEKERKQAEYQKALDDINFANFQKMNKLMLSRQ
jgi:hypothetical protein